jgi:hypothetical protein
MQGFGGVAEAVAGGALTLTGVGSGIGVAILFHGLDNSTSGFYQAETGKARQTLTSRILIGQGVSPDLAEGTERAPELYGAVLTMSPGKGGAAPMSERVTGAFQEGYPGFAERGLGRLANREIAVTERGIARIEEHLARPGFDPDPANAAMIQRLRDALGNGERIRGADASFYMHEIYESTLMNRGMPYQWAHPAALERYGVSSYSVYHPDVIRTTSGFNQNWVDFWEELARRDFNP